MTQSGGTVGRRAIAALALAALLVCGACGSSATQPHANGGSPDASIDAAVDAGPPHPPIDPWCNYPPLSGAAPATLAEFAAQLKSAICARLVRCGAFDATGQATCEAHLDANAIVQTLQSQANQVLAYDPAGGKACLDAFAQATCDKAASYCLSGQQRYEVAGNGMIPVSDAVKVDTGFAGLACARVLVPTVIAGGPCGGGSSCIAGLCKATGPGPFAQDVCSPLYGPQGTACTPGSPSAAICECAPTGGGNGICVFGPRAGDACGYPEGTCEAYSSCLAGGLCAPPGGPGDACSSGRLYVVDCKPGLYCAPSGTCSARLAEGAPCTTPFACQDGLLCVGLDLRVAPKDPTQYPDPVDGPWTVVAPGTCARPLSAGQACTPPGDPMGSYGIGADGCAFFESVCDPMAKQCAAYLLSGAPCSGGYPGCGPFSSCNPNGNTCF
jgi:hypothetical protein